MVQLKIPPHAIYFELPDGCLVTALRQTFEVLQQLPEGLVCGSGSAQKGAARQLRLERLGPPLGRGVFQLQQSGEDLFEVICMNL